MVQSSIYEDIAKRTKGDIYIGVVGPVRTGKSTFIKKFMEEMVLPNIDNEDARARARESYFCAGNSVCSRVAERCGKKRRYFGIRTYADAYQSTGVFVGRPQASHDVIFPDFCFGKWRKIALKICRKKFDFFVKNV